MPVNNYDELRISEDQQSTLSVARWNALVDELQRVENTLNRVNVSAEESGRLGIGTIPERALHIKGNGGVSDDLYMVSSTTTKTRSAAMIMVREKPDNTDLEVGAKLGMLSFRGKSGEKTTGSSGITAYYRGTEGDKYNTDLNLYHTRNGSARTALSISHTGEIQLKGSLRGAQSGGALKIQTNSGYVHIGADNSTYAHIKTDRPQFYFDKKIIAKGGSFEAYSKDNLSLITSGGTRLRILGGTGSNKGYVGINNTSPKSSLHVKGQLRVEGGGGARGWIVLGSYANNDAAKDLLKTLGNRQLIIGGVWGDNVYFYWKNKDGKRRRAMLKGGSF